MPRNTINRSRAEWTRRYVSFVFILFIIAFGTSLSIRANLGSSPISAPPYVLSLVPGIGLTMGMLTIMMHVLFIVIQMLLLRRSFERRQLLQIFVSFLFGFYTDVTMWLTSFLQIPFDINPLVGYPLRFVELLIGGALLAYGIAAEVRCDSLMLAGEGLPLAIARVTGRDFGKVKICSDTGLVVIGVTFMFIFFGHWDWKLIGVGTLVSMFYVGFMVRVFSPRIEWMDSIFIPRGEAPTAAEVPVPAAGTYPLVVTIAREYGSGGLVIGERLAQRLGIPLYDRHLIDATAQRLGYTVEQVARSEQNIPSSKLWELIFTDKTVPPSQVSDIMGTEHLSNDDAIFVSQSRTIRELAAEQSCVIVGRLANHILRDRPNVISIFVTSDHDKAVSRIMQRDHLGSEEASKRIDRVNSGRANHYWQYAGGRWTDVHNYDLVINSDTLGVDGAVAVICQVAARGEA